MKKLKKRLLVSILILSIIAFALGYVLLIHVAPYAIIKPPRTSKKINPDDFNLNYEQLNIAGKDSVQLATYWIKSELDTTKAIIITLHGIGDVKETFLSFSKLLAQNGYASILLDHRAQGKSGGQYCTFGYKEKEDIQKVIDFVQAIDQQTPIGILGHSLGGAIALQALELDQRIAFGIIQSTFMDLHQIVYDYKKRLLFGIGSHWVTNLVLRQAGKIAQFDPHVVKPIESAKEIEQPILLIHGEADDRIRVDYGKALFEQLQSEQKELFIVPEAGHNDVASIAGKQYLERVFQFLERIKM